MSNENNLIFRETATQPCDLKKKTCCFTGYRPQKLPWKFNNSSKEYLRVADIVENLIEQSVKKGYRYFISGMAIGFDTLCAETVLKIKASNPDIKLICALPCKEQDKYWSDLQRQNYERILTQADAVRYVSEKYTKFCMQKRNKYMISNSSLVIALFDGQPGGTKSTLAMAKKPGLDILIISP